jgi:Flp pilus assembly protein TadG
MPRMPVPRTPARLASRLREDRGSVSLWVVLFTFVALAMLILVVDGGQVIVAKSRAADIAEQAARAAADQIDPAALRNGQVQIAADACAAAASLVATYAKGVGVTATMVQPCQPGTDVQGAPDMTVQVQVQMKPVFPVFPFGTINVQAAETAYLACGSADARTAC